MLNPIIYAHEKCSLIYFNIPLNSRWFKTERLEFGNKKLKSIGCMCHGKSINNLQLIKNMR